MRTNYEHQTKGEHQVFQKKSSKSMFLIVPILLALVVALLGEPAAKADLLSSGNRVTVGQIAKHSGIEFGTTATKRVDIAQNTSKYTDPISVNDVEELAFLVTESEMASGGTLTYTLQTGVTINGTDTWWDYQQMSAVDAAPYATGSALQYQPTYLSYTVAAASKGSRCLVFNGWKPANRVRMKISTDASHASTVTLAYWLLK